MKILKTTKSLQATHLFKQPIKVRTDKLSARFVLFSDAYESVYPPEIRAEVDELLEVSGPVLSAEQVEKDPSLLEGVQAIVSGWGAPRLSEQLLDAAKELEVVFYGGGATHHIVTDAARQRGVQVTSCNATNALPVVEYTMAQIVMCLKRIWQQAFEMKVTRRWDKSDPGATCYGSTVGVMSLGDIGLRVAERLAEMDIRVLVYDIAQDESLAKRAGFEYVTLDRLFAESDVVTVHTPLRPETIGLVDAKLLESLKPGASLINTARGAVIDHSAMIQVFRRRSDLFAVLDVVDPEPLSADSELWLMPNIVMTPHLAGSVGRECHRMGRQMVDDIKLYLQGKPMLGQVC